MDLLTLGLFAFGFVFLVVGADTLVAGASKLAEAIHISPLVVGLTVVAFGSSAPELAINVISAYQGKPGLAIGNVVGSNIANVLLILGCAALITPLMVTHRLLKLDVPLMIGASFVMLFMAMDGLINRWEGLALFTAIVVYTVYAIVKGRQEGIAAKQAAGEAVGTHGTRYILIQTGLILVGLVMLTVGAKWLVEGAIVIARALNVSELVIGLTIVAIGTSLPELATSIAAGLRRETDMAVGNVVGSNLFNILSVLGITALVAPNGIAVEQAAINFDIPVMIVVALACLPVFFTGKRIDRWEGWLFLSYYLAYLTYLVLNATSHSLLPAFNHAMLWFVIPLTVVTMVVLVWHEKRQT